MAYAFWPLLVTLMTLSPGEPRDLYTPEPPAPRGVLYVVIDDLGARAEPLEAFLATGIPLTYAILPGLDHSETIRRRLQEAGEAYILHQPMEALGGQDPGPGAILAAMSPAEAREVFRRNIASLPGLRGFNNHMGSRLSTEAPILEALLDEAALQGLAVLDSRTIGSSLIGRLGREKGLETKERHIFLDDPLDTLGIAGRLDQALSRALAEGEAVIIGHIWSESLPGILESYKNRVGELGLVFAVLPAAPSKP